MDLNINKYDSVNFHKDNLTHKRIKALLLWFEYEVHKNNLSLENQVLLMEKWLDRLLLDEYYEVLPFFKRLKADMEEKLKNPNHATISEILIGNNSNHVIKSLEMVKDVEKNKRESFLTRIHKKLINWYRK